MSTQLPETSPAHLAPLRRARNRRASQYAQVNFFTEEISGRMFERLDYIKLNPQVVLDLNCAIGTSSNTLARRFPDALVIPCDQAIEMLQRHAAPKRRFPWFGKNSARACGEALALPFAAKSIDLVWSNLFPLSFDAPAIIREAKRVLKPGGLLMYSTVGPDTLKEMRTAFSKVDALPHIQPQVDMHDLGDMLAQEGFVTPVVDMEMVTLTYPDVKTLARDLRAAAASNLETNRRSTLTGKNRWQALERAYEAFRHEGRLPATFEIIYLHAWRGVERIAADGRQIIQFDKLAEKK
jgi:malonyl-CoA O-methyltransferase